MIEQSSGNPRNALVRRNECRKLQEKITMRENVIRKLTEQLILYKDLEKDLQNKNLILEMRMNEMENPEGCEFNGRGATGDAAGLSSSSASYARKNADAKQTLTKEMSNRATYLEQMNKKLMKSITLECQQKRKLEGQIKQRDNQIKELNWKLDKASKFLERAEKNTNTYRRKMLNMQTFMRRKKILDEQTSRFNEMLMDSEKEGYSEETLAMAMEMREICGTDGYNRLLNFGFPLPALSALRGENPSDSNESNDRTTTEDAVPLNVNALDADCLATRRDYSHREVLVVDDATETITGTVQDIFDENNDADDFGTNELREHFILQLNSVL